MNYRSIHSQLIWAMLLSLSVVSVNAQPEHSTSPVPGPPSVSSTPLASDSSSERRLSDVEKEIQGLKKSPKDVWDKLSAVSGLISGSLVVLVGLLVTYVLNERNRITAEQQKNRELAVSQVQTVQSFMPLLQTGGPKEVEAALLAIFALDTNSKLATDLASLYRNEGSISALRKIASGPDMESARRAQQALADFVTVSLKGFSPDLDDLRLSVSTLRTFNDLTNQIFWALKGAVQPFTYEKAWILRNKPTGKTLHKRRTEDGSIAPIDIRCLKEVGVEPGMTLEALPLNCDSQEAPEQSQE